MTKAQYTAAKIAAALLGTMGSTRHTAAQIQNAVTVAWQIIAETEEQPPDEHGPRFD